ncbi:SDR family NAD(P)-dependent oxidoreductase [Haloarcula sp. JP-L23]|uniref:SDR family NAD(P)-dependent oxidoreductase n=1 Tax=Haloarcula sp. JP-L23 TaxID=2716717 RepID=UPI00140F443B|nr:SDR family oxidoreductase [Haloarcula sp. JP-L23]
MTVNIDLSDETVLVTGAGRGIGAEIARTFARAGANVVLAARTESELRSTADELESDYEVEALAVPTDLTAVEEIEALIEHSVAEFGTPTVLVNNAGANISGNPVDHTPDEIDTMLDVNIRGLFLLTQRWAEAFRDSDRQAGRIVNVSSIVADLGVPAMTLYAGTKAAVRSITQGFAAELANDGVTVNSVSPGLTRVDRTEAVMDEHGNDLFEYDRIPLGRVGEPQDTANACLFFASDLADYVTGVDLLVDGGVEFTAGLYK